MSQVTHTTWFHAHNRAAVLLTNTNKVLGCVRPEGKDWVAVTHIPGEKTKRSVFKHHLEALSFVQNEASKIVIESL